MKGEKHIVVVIVVLSPFPPVAFDRYAQLNTRHLEPDFWLAIDFVGKTPGTGLLIVLVITCLYNVHLHTFNNTLTYMHTSC